MPRKYDLVCVGETHDQPNDQVLWLLHAQADVPGVDYLDDFEVPVFRLTPLGATTPAATGFADSQPEAAPAFQSDASDVVAPDNLKVVVSSGPTGELRVRVGLGVSCHRQAVVVVVGAGRVELGGIAARLRRSRACLIGVGCLLRTA